MELNKRYEAIQERIKQSCKKAGRNPEEVNLIAVTKYVSVETTQSALKCGVRHIGENRSEGLFEKQEVIGRETATWHFIGTLQSRKVKEVLPYIDFLHSLDRLSLAKEIEKRAENSINCFVQVNVSGEASKHGIELEKTKTFIQQLASYSKINVVGLMTMAPLIDDREALRTLFKKLKICQEEIAALGLPNAPCLELSMGMSNDFDLAIEEGATFVRVGTALVGKER